MADEIRIRVAKHERVLVTTITKHMAEDLTEHLLDEGFKVNYMHSDTATLDRIDIIRALRTGHQMWSLSRLDMETLSYARNKPRNIPISSLSRRCFMWDKRY